MFLSKLKLSVAALVFGGGFASLIGTLAGPGLGGRVGAQESPMEQGKAAKPEAPATLPEHTVPNISPPDAGEPARLVRAVPAPAPWETAARIRVLGQGSVGFGSGTIIHSTPTESLILTCAHIFKLDGPRQVAPDKFPRKVLVDLFDGKLRGDRPDQVTFDVTTGGAVVDYDFVHDVGLVRIRPGKQLPDSPVVPTRWEAQAGMKMLTVGCTEGRDATAWHTKLIRGEMRGLSGNPSYEAIACTTAPKQGRAGGGLFTTDGYLAGVCNFAEPQGNQGLFAPPKSIYGLLDRNGLSHLYTGEASMVDFGTWIRAEAKPIKDAPPVPPGGEVPEGTEPPPKADGQEARLEELSRENARLRDEVRQLRDERHRSGLLTSPRAGRPVTGPNVPPGEPAGPVVPFAGPSPIAGTEPPAREPGSQDGAQGHRRIGGLVFAASPTGNRVIAYDPVTRWTAAIEVRATKETPLKLNFFSPPNDFRSGLVALQLAGREIRRIAAFDLKSRTWHAHDLAEPVYGQAIPYQAGDGSVAYDLGRHLYTFNSKSLAWDHLDVSAIPDAAEDSPKDGAKPGERSPK
jgi:hypothetical protein